ncbi:hypothetical protein [Mycolicibacterium fortuitum]|uniref:hypothetical protein n=1 Tax=Mycolicibacterium fortuitum TaxID=1766 RepID=UPI00149031EB|nr:hypothetical protein [Mycolicibacterium fortuitum]NOR01361.1 hypothetical protein [Mycolicibacterium fortuitum]
MPRPADLRRAAEIVLAWRKGDAHLAGTVLAEADREDRVSFTVAALAFLCNRELDNTANTHGEEAVEAAIREMIAAISATEEDQ